jgi:hypothetical protein
MKMDALIKEIKQQKGLVIAIIAAGLIFGFVVGRAIKGKEAGEIISDEQKATTTAETLIGKTEKNTPNLSTVALIGDQPAGKAVNVSKVSLSDNAWVVVREDANGEMGNILGAQWLPKGTVSETTVDLLRGTESGKKYYVVLYNDNGDRIFGMTSDFPMKNNGALISMTFTAK